MFWVSQYLMYAVIVINAIASVRRWRRDRSGPSACMALGSVGAVIGFAAVQFLGYPTKGVESSGGAVTLEPTVWLIPGRILFIFGLVLFCIGYAIDSFRPSKR